MFFVQLTTTDAHGERHLRWYEVEAANLPQAQTAAAALVRQEINAMRIRFLETRRI